jgi:hypothetical protein
MLTCTPVSLFSWNYTVKHPTQSQASVEFDWFTEQGRIRGTLGTFEVRKHGLLSGRWTLERNGQVMCEATKPSLSRVFEIRQENLRITLQAAHPFTRTFHLLEQGQPIGTITPLHPFSRRATVHCTRQIPETVQLFCFWLTAMSWRRRYYNNNSAAN